MLQLKGQMVNHLVNSQVQRFHHIKDHSKI